MWGWWGKTKNRNILPNLLLLWQPRIKITLCDLSGKETSTLHLPWPRRRRSGNQRYDDRFLFSILSMLAITNIYQSQFKDREDNKTQTYRWVEQKSIHDSRCGSRITPIRLNLTEVTSGKRPQGPWVLFEDAFSVVFVFVFRSVSSCLLITLIICIKCHKSITQCLLPLIISWSGRLTIS